MSASKRLAMVGQSNAGLFVFGNSPAGLMLYRDGPGGASIEEGPPGADVPYYWRSDDGFGALANLAAFLEDAAATPIVCWFHGEVATNEDPNTHYGADVVGLIGDIDALSGRSDTIWITIKLNANASLDASALASVRDEQDEAAAALPTRFIIVDCDDITPGVDGVHYTSAQYQNTIWPRVLAAAATATSDPTWEP